MSTLSQRSFAGGEIAPSLYARADFAKYQSSVKTLRNFYIQKHGGISNRSGTKFINYADTYDRLDTVTIGKNVRLIPYNTTNAGSYVLAFGPGSIIPIKDDNYIFEDPVAITSIDHSGSSTIASLIGHGLENGEIIYVYSSSQPDHKISGRYYYVGGAATNTFRLRDISTFVNLDFSSEIPIVDVFYKKVYQIIPFDTLVNYFYGYYNEDIFNIKYTQQNDSLILTSKDYPPVEITRITDTNWSFSKWSPSNSVPYPTNLSYTSVSSSQLYYYTITAFDRKTGQESFCSTDNLESVTNITNANPANFSGSILPSDDGLEWLFTVGGMQELNGKRLKVRYTGTSSGQLVGVNSTDFGAFVSGSAYTTYMKALGANTLTSTDYVDITWSHSGNSDYEYRIYKKDKYGSNFGLLGISSALSFRDIGQSVDYSINPPSGLDVFINTNDKPGCCGFYQQRLAFGSTNNDPDKVILSKLNDFKNFSTSYSSNDADSIKFKVASKNITEIKHILDLGKLILLTAGGEAVCGGSSSEAITPTDVNVKFQSYNGSSDVAPAIINNNALYVQSRGSIIRDLSYSFDADGYTGNDLTILAFHLFEGYTIKEMAFQQNPHSILWVVRSDGVLLGLTYLKDQQIYGWHRHDFQDGSVESVCVVPDGNEDVVYIVVSRTIDGKACRYIEKISSRYIYDEKLMSFVDSHVTVDGRHTGTTTMTLSGGTSWTYTESLTLTASSDSGFSNRVGDYVFLRLGDSLVKCEITASASDTVCTVKPNKTVPTSMRSVALTDWGFAVSSITGLWHLEGQDVSVFADNFVAANPNNDSYTVKTVTNGTVNLDRAYEVITVGLPYISDVETLSIDTAQGETLIDKKILIQDVTMFVEKTRGLFAGAREPEIDPLDGLNEVKARSYEGYDEPISLKTGVSEVKIQSEYNSNGRVFIRQVDPLPATILSINPSGYIPNR